MSEASRTPGARPAQGRVGTQVNGKWTIDARIGSGGMATVYSATHRNGHRAALKMLHTQLSRDEATRARFLREGYVANAVGHAGVVKVEDDGVTEDGCAFLVLDLLEGDTIEARRERLGGMLPIDEALEIGDQALDVLAAAHDKGIIHRDVKPENVFLTMQGEVKLLDFGLARMKSAQAETTKTGVTIGTPAFMPPEQAQGRRDEVDARSDVWGMGATLFTAITGQYVHNADTLHEQLVASATMRARPIRELAPHVSADVANVIDRALELDKADRWASARDMQRALRAARASQVESDRILAESLTMPALTPRRVDVEPRSGPRPSGPLPVPSSDRTIDMKVPSSDPTLDELVPITILERAILLENLPSSSNPLSKPPSTERLTGQRGSDAQQAQAALARSGQSSQLAPQTPRMGPETPTGGVPMVSMQQRAQASMQQPAHASMQQQAPLRPSAQPTLATLASSGSGPQAMTSASGPYPALGTASNPYPSLSQSGPYPSVEQRSAGSGPPPPAPLAPSPAAAPPPQEVAPGPASLRARRSSRVVVIVCVVLIVLSAGFGAWALYGPKLPFHF